MAYNSHPEWMFSQRDPRWANTKIGKSGLAMKDFGCVISCTAYIIARWRGKKLEPGAWCDWLNRRNLFTADGRLYWSAIEQFTNGGLRYTTSHSTKTYVLRNVLFGRYSHWVVDLRNGMVFDPWDGTIKDHRQTYWRDTGERRYFRAFVKPKT